MDYRRLIIRFRQFGGIRLVRKYIGMGLFWPIVKAFFSCLMRGQSFKHIYPVILQKVEPFLEQRYAPMVQEFKKSSRCSRLEHKRNKIIWFCWLQGMEQAPELVHVCYESLKQNLPDREINVIDAKNWKEYIELPDYVFHRWEKKQIAPANFSDLLRLELLIKYGGTWVDSTVLCTGFKFQDQSFKYLDADLFLFQYTPDGTTKGVSISNWFITSCTNNEVLMAVRDMISHVPFHKLSYRVNEAIMGDKNNYYNWVLNLYLKDKNQA